MKLWIRLIDRLVTVSTFVGTVSLALMMLLIVSDVISSNLFNRPIPAGSAIVTHYGMVLVTFVPMALAETMGSHVKVDVVFEQFPESIQKVVSGFAKLFTVIVCCALTYGLWGSAIKKMNIGSYIFEQSVKVATWPGQFVLPFGFGLLAIVILTGMIGKGTTLLKKSNDPIDKPSIYSGGTHGK